jgi:uncharacterized protein (TIGR01732 family)
MYGYENSPHVAGANVPHVAGVNVPHQPVMPYSYAAPTPSYGYCAPSYGCNTFVLIVVLFILLIIVGATIYGNKC